VVGLRGLKSNPARLTYVTTTVPARRAQRRDRRRQRRVSRRLEHETIDRLVAEYVAGATAAELGRRYGIAKSSVLQLGSAAARAFDIAGWVRARHLNWLHSTTQD
jgi:hypothetical protein